MRLSRAKKLVDREDAGTLVVTARIGVRKGQIQRRKTLPAQGGEFRIAQINNSRYLPDVSNAT